MAKRIYLNGFLEMWGEIKNNKKNGLWYNTNWRNKKEVYKDGELLESLADSKKK
ncbi:hypothetical protein [Helicobacter hepaticus]|mgnify:CR=1 FL=1|jgi:hypothetical protein|uniref:Uncharacterized protein n=1 Tax=Helicobacter hepaticus (strain ATCC 51449 / 3B1) TaxID=235279 RepID=Q7VH35_HELHP|nr:hypothetical protein [Helicobacter hepaticus]AAP77729.1 hypothetical protein HH_1132 [Helicobacter hepaticus ATCC 51449]